MSAENSIILITNNEDVAQILKPQLVLLRDIDSISVSNYADAIKNVKAASPDAILLHCEFEKQECLNLVREIKADDALKNIALLLVVNEYDQDFVLNVYDEDITDFFVLESNEAEILMRFIWGLKKNLLINKVRNQQNLLEQLNVINPKTGFYTHQFCEAVFENEFKIIVEKNVEAILMAISPSEDSKTKLTPTQFAAAIKKSTRNSDVVAHGPGNKFYILLPKTPLKGAFCVWDKIKKAVGEEFHILAGAGSVEGKTFVDLKNELLNALVEAEATKTDLVVATDKEEQVPGDWLEKISSTQKNFKLFKQAFNKKLEQVITPVFFQLQKLYEEKLFKTKIEQYCNSTLSSFSLKKLDNESELKITYPGFSKINIDIIHQGLDSPENRRISLDLTELDESALTKIVEDFIKEFKKSAKDKLIDN